MQHIDYLQDNRGKNWTTGGGQFRGKRILSQTGKMGLDNYIIMLLDSCDLPELDKLKLPHKALVEA